MFCSKCGFNNADSFEYCQQCGNKLSPEPAAQPTVSADTIVNDTYKKAPQEPPAAVSQSEAPAQGDVPPAGGDQPYAAPQYGDRPQYGADPGAGSQYGAQQGAQPQYAAGQSAGQQYGAPGYGQPQYTAPQYGAQPQYGASGYAQPQYGAGQQYAAQAPSSAIGVLKALCKSPLFIIAAIAATISSAVGLYSVIDTLSLYSRYGRYFSDVDVGTTIGTAIAILIGLIVVVALWVIFAAANNNYDNMPTGGFTAIKAVAVIYTVFVSIAAVALEALIFLSDRTLRYYLGFDSDSMVIVALAVAIVFGLLILYYAKIIQTLNAAKSVANTGRPNTKASAFVGVVLFIIAALSILSFFFSAIGSSSTEIFGININLFGNGSTMSTISSICSIVSYICFGALIFKYNSSMRTYIYSDAGSQYGAAGYGNSPYGYQQPNGQNYYR